MAYRHDRLRHGRVAQHISFRREKTQQVPEAPSPSDQTESSTSGARASPHAPPSSSSRRIQNPPSSASLPLSSYRCQVSPMPPPTNDVADPDPPLIPPLYFLCIQTILSDIPRTKRYHQLNSLFIFTLILISDIDYF